MSTAAGCRVAIHSPVGDKRRGPLFAVRGSTERMPAAFRVPPPLHSREGHNNAMGVRQHISLAALCLGFALALPLVAQAQKNSSTEDIGNPLTGPVVRGAPFSAEATTTVHETLRDGTRIDRTTTARYYRDGTGRVRVEQPIVRSTSPNRAAEKQVRITMDSGKGGDVLYVLDPAARTAGIGSRGLGDLAVGGGSTFALPLEGPQFLIFIRPASARAEYL